jgi:formate/nitrite transporter
VDGSFKGAQMGDLVQIDPYAPAEIAKRVESAGVKKANLDLLNILTLGVLAGAFIALGAHLATVVGADSGLGYGPTRMMVGVAFSVGLILVVIAGAELFTGNTLIVMAWLGKKVSSRLLLRNWTIAYVANFIGALATAFIVVGSGLWELAANKVGAGALTTANAKVGLDWDEALLRGILCNALVNLAVWLCFSARSNVDKIFAIIPPIAAFVASGYEHSIANMFFIPVGLLLKDKAEIQQAAGLEPAALGDLTWGGFLWNNLLPVTIGNIIGGALMVAAVYWLVYLRPRTQAAAQPEPGKAPVGRKEMSAAAS